MFYQTVQGVSSMFNFKKRIWTVLLFVSTMISVFLLLQTIPAQGFAGTQTIDTIGVYRPGEAKFYLKYSIASGISDTDFVYGIRGDIPIVGDWTGKGYGSIGIYRPSEAKF